MDTINEVPGTAADTRTENTQPVYTQPAPVSKEPFSIKPREGFAALLMLVAAYLYICMGTADESYRLLLGLTALLLAGITELIHSGTRRSAESWIWFGCFVLTTLSLIIDMSTVWVDGEAYIFMHIFFVWWVLSRSGRLLESESGHLLPFDAFNAFLGVPFSNFFLKERTLFRWIKDSLFPGKRAGKRNYWIIPGAIICLALFFASGDLLARADSSFGVFFRQISDFISNLLNEGIILKFVFSIPVGCWLFGLISGLARTDSKGMARQRGGIYVFLDSLKKLPDNFWSIVIGLFSLMYLSFFILQGSYLFGAFTRSLPEGFIVSQYAREGFFELCKLTALNFVLLWLATRTVSAADASNRIYRTACLVLLAENALFAIIAFSKLALYISCFGFTPLRLQSTWLVCLLFAGCVLWTVALTTGKKVFRLWMYFGAVTLTILTLV